MLHATPVRACQAWQKLRKKKKKREFINFQQIRISKTRVNSRSYTKSPPPCRKFVSRYQLRQQIVSGIWEDETRLHEQVSIQILPLFHRCCHLDYTFYKIHVKLFVSMLVNNTYFAISRRRVRMMIMVRIPERKKTTIKELTMENQWICTSLIAK